jgi:hypothetical protein
MATRNTISRIRSRIDELTERHTPSGGPILIAVRDEAEYRARLREIEAGGGPSGRRVIFIRTNVICRGVRPVGASPSFSVPLEPRQAWIKQQ